MQEVEMSVSTFLELRWAAIHAFLCFAIPHCIMQLAACMQKQQLRQLLSLQSHLMLCASCLQKQKLKKAEQRKLQQANKASNKAALAKAAEQQAIKDEAAAIVAAAFAQGAESEDAHPKPDPEPPLSIKEQAAAIAAAAFAQAPPDAQQVRDSKDESSYAGLTP